MEKFTKLTGVAAPLPMINVDTDMIIPKQFLKTIQRTGLGKALFDEMRYNQDGSEKPDFVLNKPAYRKAKILVTGDNFGCGSSREHAPWALLDFGIRCVIAPSFADIFYDNCFKNGILPITLPQEHVDKLMDDAERGANAIISIDLEKQEIRGPDGGMIKFEIDAFRKQCLLNGWDDIGLTLRRRATRSTPSRTAAEAEPALALIALSCSAHSVPRRLTCLEVQPQRTTMTEYKHAPLLPGDGIGPEVMDATVRVVGWFGQKRPSLRDRGSPGGRRGDRRHGVPIPTRRSSKAIAADAVLMGSVGGPKWDDLPFDKKPERGLLRLRKEHGRLRQPAPGAVLRRAEGCLDA